MEQPRIAPAPARAEGEASFSDGVSQTPTAIHNGVDYTVNPNGSLSRYVADAAGGPEWHEVHFPWNGPDDLRRFRNVPSTDGGPPWSERWEPGDRVWRKRDGQEQYLEGGELKRTRDEQLGRVETRDYSGGREVRRTVHHQSEHGASLAWETTEDGITKFSRTGTGMQLEAEAKGPPHTLFDSIKIYGAPSDTELSNIQKALEQVPEDARKLVTTVYLVDDIGHTRRASDGCQLTRTRGAVEALLPGAIYVDRQELQSLSDTKHVLYHEMGHILDDGKSLKAPWGQGRSVSNYGQTSAFEDFAETHRVVLENFARLSHLPPEEWLSEPQRAKKQAMLEHYGVQPAVSPEGWVHDAERDVLKRTTPDPEGGPAWTEYRDAGGRIDRIRTVPANDGGPAWKEYEWEFAGLQRERTRVVWQDGHQYIERQCFRDGQLRSTDRQPVPPDEWNTPYA